MTKRRVIILTSVYVLFLIHVAHWLIFKKTVAPAELNETMFTIEEGVVTVGAILLVVILLSVLLFGRFFCSWGCHILALQDLASWGLSKLNIKAIPIRSRLLPLVAIGGLLYMFVWPTIVRLYVGKSWPGLRVLTDDEGLGSFTTEQLTRNLPGPFMTTITFVVVGGFVVWLLGSRAFCRFVCPYGALFAAFDRVSPAGIQLVGDCDGCGHCTAVCTTHIRVHHEIQVHGRVVTPGCLKDLDCVASCPKDAIKFGYSKPAFFASFSNFTNPSVPWAWNWCEEIFASVICLGTLLATRQLYGEIPFLLALTFGIMFAWASLKTWNLCTSRHSRFLKLQLKRNGEYCKFALLWVCLYTLCTVLLVHSGWIRWHEYQGRKAWAQVQLGDISQIEPMVYHLNKVIDHGIWHPPYPDSFLAELWIRSGETEKAIPHIEFLVQTWPNDAALKETLEQLRSIHPIASSP